MRTFMSMTNAILQQLDMISHAISIQRGARRGRQLP
jgi:hypothetical protein